VTCESTSDTVFCKGNERKLEKAKFMTDDNSHCAKKRVKKKQKNRIKD